MPEVVEEQLGDGEDEDNDPPDIPEWEQNVLGEEAKQKEFERTREMPAIKETAPEEVEENNGYVMNTKLV